MGVADIPLATPQESHLFEWDLWRSILDPHTGESHLDRELYGYGQIEETGCEHQQKGGCESV